MNEVWLIPSCRTIQDFDSLWGKRPSWMLEWSIRQMDVDPYVCIIGYSKETAYGDLHLSHYIPRNKNMVLVQEDDGLPILISREDFEDQYSLTKDKWRIV